MRPTRKGFITAVVGDRRGAVALMFALTVPALLGIAAIAVDGGVYYLEQSRLQFAADAAAMGASRLLGTNPSQDALQSAALQAVTDATGGTLAGTVATPITVSATGTAVSVTVTSRADGFFASALGAAVPSLQASAVAGSITKSCIFTTPSTINQALKVDNEYSGGGVISSNCGIFSNSSASQSVYVASGTIEGTSVGAVGTVYLTPYDGTISPNPTSDAPPQQDAFAGMSPPPIPGGCNYTNASFTAYQSTPYKFTGNTVFCGNTTIGGNGSSDTFAPGIYYVVGGSLTFNNANATFDTAGVSFVLTSNASYPNVGGFTWTNYSNSYAWNASSALSGILVWQTPPSSGCSTSAAVNPTSSFQGGSTLVLNGAFYAPCGGVDIGNGSQMTTASDGSLSVTAETIYVHGGAKLSAGSAVPPGGGVVAVLLQ